MKEPIFYLSNSKLHDWEKMCPIEWKAKHIDKSVEWKETQQMRWGTFFETLVIGSGVGGKVIKLSAQEMNSVYYERVKAQAKKCRGYLKLYGGEVKSRQEYIRGIIHYNGQDIAIEGGLDIRYWIGDERRIVIDLKLTGDTENEFGKFSWGSPEKMDLSQIIQYTTLHQLKYGGDYPEGEYWVFDNGTEMKEKLITVDISETTRLFHFQRLADAYNEILFSLQMDDWTPKNTYENCSKCLAPCKFRRIMPEFYKISI